METIKQRIDSINWDQIAESMHNRGFALAQGVLNDVECMDLINLYNTHTGFRKTVVMERHRYGKGEYKYFSYPLPDILQTIRENVYPQIAPIANTWMKSLKIDKQFPNSFQELQALCVANNQIKPTVLILKYGKGGYNALHQDLYGEVYFPMQLVLFLNEPGKDYTGGEFVLVQQIPRAQSQAIVLNPKKGDMLIFTTNFRSEKGTRGYHRVNMKHGVSELTEGERHTAGIIFHDAL